MNYQYKARTASGQTVEDIISAVDPEDLLAKVNSSGRILVSYRPAEGVLNKLMRPRIAKRDIIIFSRQFSVMISAGISIQESVHLLADSATKKQMKQVLEEIYDDLRMGSSLAQSMRKHKEVFDDFYIGMVEVGEFSGSFDETMRRVADFYENDGKFQKILRGALTYPLILIVLAIIVTLFLMTVVVPTFSDMIVQNGQEVPMLTQIVTNISQFLINNMTWILGGTAVIITAAAKYARTDAGKRQIDSAMLKIPLIASIVSKLTASRFARCMDILTKSGITIMQSFELVDSMISNTVIKGKFSIARDGVMTGLSYAKSLERMDVFPKILISMVSVGEKTGALPAIFDKTADFFDEEAQEAMQTMVKLIEPLILLFIAANIVIIILSVMLPMIGMMNAI